jgi:hypothetical protein
MAGATPDAPTYFKEEDASTLAVLAAAERGAGDEGDKSYFFRSTSVVMQHNR